MTLLTCWVAWHKTRRIFSLSFCFTKINRVNYPRNFGNAAKEGNPFGSVLFHKSKFLVSCTWTCQESVGHTSNSTVNSCTDGTTEQTEDEGLGINICCSSASALCQTGNSPAVPLSKRNLAGRTDQARTPWHRGATKRNSGKQDEKGNGLLEYDSPSDDGDIPSLERGSRFVRSISFNSRIVFC